MTAYASRAAPEVRQRGIYSKEGDVFSLVTTFWEIFHVIGTRAFNPSALDTHLVPLATVELSAVGPKLN